MNFILCIACLFIPSHDPRFLPQHIPTFPEISQIDLRDQCAEPLACTWPLNAPPSYRLWLLSRDTALLHVIIPGLSDHLFLVKLDPSQDPQVTILKAVRPAF